MKKKNKPKKKADMPEFQFKEFTEEESRIYSEAVEAFRQAVGSGKTLRQAYDSYTVADQELANLIQADFLKIMIAERHFGQGQPLDEIAKAFDVPVTLVKETHARMLQEVGITAANQFGREFGGLAPETND
jgi:hypothetical protein